MLLQIVAQFLVVFDNAIVHDRNIVLRHVRVRIAFVRRTVRCPTRVRNSTGAPQRFFIKRILQLLNFANPADACD